MDKLLDAFNQLKLNQEDINQLLQSTTHNEIEAVIIFQQRRIEDLMESQPNSTRSLKKTSNFSRK
jgi:hypothetical protein